MAAAAAYRLEAPRSRIPPPPIRVQSPSYRSSTVFRKSVGEPELLYDLPTSSISVSSPPPTSPTSPTSHVARRRAVSPPASRARSSTPSQPLKSDLERFADQCRAWYYNQDDEAGRLMTQTLTTLPSSERAPFARLQAAVRSGYHAHMAARRNAEFLARVNTVQPGGSLAAHARADPSSAVAAKERHERFERFVRNWCTSGMPGTKPFFEGLWAVMRLQVIPEDLGGAGVRRIEWEVDDAVFKEAAGKDFMLEAVDVLKGVLAFEDFSSCKRSESWSRPGSSVGMFAEHSRSQSQPLPSALSISNKSGPSIATTIQAKRTRAPSDPFLDMDMPGLSHSLASSASTLPQGASTLPRTPTTPSAEGAPESGNLLTPRPRQTDGDESDSDDGEEYIRVWTTPDLPDAEFLTLLKLFPVFVSARPLARFPVSERALRGRVPDEEEADDADTDGRDVKHGTGRMWVGARRRRSTNSGGWWSRFVGWVRRVFC